MCSGKARILHFLEVKNVEVLLCSSKCNMHHLGRQALLLPKKKLEEISAFIFVRPHEMSKNSSSTELIQ